MKSFQIVDKKGEMHSVTDWDLVLAVNLSGTFHLTRLVAKYLICVPKEDTLDGERGVIIMISSSTAVGCISAKAFDNLTHNLTV